MNSHLCRLQRWLLRVALLVGASTGLLGKDATLEAYCLSVNLSPSTAILGGSKLETYFTTYDGSSGLPLYDTVGNLNIFSGELSPNPNMPGNYRTDYVLFQNGVANSTGTDTADLPTADTDGNGVADFLQVARNGTVAFSGRVRRELPTASLGSPMTGQITRAAGSFVGSYYANVSDPNAGIVTYRGTSYLLNAQGTLTYDRSNNTAVIVATLSNEDGTQTTYSGSATFAVLDANTISFPSILSLGSNGRVVQGKPFILVRSGKRYLGNIEFQDGGLSTSWRDYVQWRMEITDNNDADSNGIPDLSDSVAVAPVIVAQPQPATATVGQAVQFSVTATGSAPLTYQWQRNSQNLLLATASTYVLANAQLANAGDYRVVVSNRAGDTTSQVAKLTVNPGAVAPVIVGQPQPAIATVGQAVQFSVTATGSAPLSYQWQRNNQNILSATDATYVVASAQIANSGDYRVIVGNGAGNTTSQVAKLIVSELVPELRIAQLRLLPTAEIDVDVNVDSPGDYILETSSDFKTWTTIRTFSTSQVALTVRAPNPTASERFFRLSHAAVVSTGPTFIQQPQDVSMIAGATVVFSVKVGGAGPFTYQWLHDGVPLLMKTAATLTISRVRSSDAGKYSVIVTGSTGTTTSNEAILTVEN